MGLRLGTDLDGVVAPVARGWTAAHDTSVHASLLPAMVTAGDGPLVPRHLASDGHHIVIVTRPVDGAVDIDDWPGFHLTACALGTPVDRCTARSARSDP